jgi:hypothetical protein
MAQNPNELGTRLAEHFQRPSSLAASNAWKSAAVELLAASA